MKRALLPAAGLISLVLLSGCSGPAAAEIPPQTARPSASPEATPTAPGASPAEASETPLAPVEPIPGQPPIPTDCRAILTPEVLDQLANVTLNHPEYGDETGPQPDGSLLCMWGEPNDPNNMLVTQISRPAGDVASELLASAQEAGLECTEGEGAVRCSGEYTVEGSPPVGRTVFTRDGILIDTQYMNLAPDGYTNAIIASMWP